MLLEAIDRVSSRQFKIGRAADPFIFLMWFLNTLHMEMQRNSPIFRSLQGSIRTVVRVPSSTDSSSIVESASAMTPFLSLTLTLPPMPVFTDYVKKEAQIPTVPLHALLRQFDGVTTTLSTAKKNIDKSGNVGKDLVVTERVQKLTRLPPYLLLRCNRFTVTDFMEEKNQTRVIFPLKGLDMAPYLESSQVSTTPTTANTVVTLPTIEVIMSWPVGEIKKRLEKSRERALALRHSSASVDVTKIVEKRELAELFLARLVAFQEHSSAPKPLAETKYNLVSVIVHDGKTRLSKAELAAMAAEEKERGAGTSGTTGISASTSSMTSVADGIEASAESRFRTYALHEATDTWYETTDTEVHTGKIMEEMVAASEAYILLYKRIDQKEM